MCRSGRLAMGATMRARRRGRSVLSPREIVALAVEDRDAQADAARARSTICGAAALSDMPLGAILIGENARLFVFAPS